MNWNTLTKTPEFCSAYFPPGITCGVWIGVVDQEERLAWKRGELGAVTLHYPFSFHVQGQGISIVPTFPVLDTVQSMDVKPFALSSLGLLIDQGSQYICKENQNLFSDYCELILRVSADKSNLVLASPADLGKLRKH
jgi:hypothetical protein